MLLERATSGFAKGESREIKAGVWCWRLWPLGRSVVVRYSPLPPVPKHQFPLTYHVSTATALALNKQTGTGTRFPVPSRRLHWLPAAKPSKAWTRGNLPPADSCHCLGQNKRRAGLDGNPPSLCKTTQHTNTLCKRRTGPFAACKACACPKCPARSCFQCRYHIFRRQHNNKTASMIQAIPFFTPWPPAPTPRPPCSP
jgi:hypothetical protein